MMLRLAQSGALTKLALKDEMNPKQHSVARVFCALVVGWWLFAATSAAIATTAPTGNYTVLVRITNNGLKLFEFVGYDDAPFADLVPTSGPVPRGIYMAITVVNDSSRPQNFALLGKTTPTIRPHHKGHLQLVLAHRGQFRYGSTLDKAASFHGTLKVY